MRQSEGCSKTSVKSQRGPMNSEIAGVCAREGVGRRLLSEITKLVGLLKERLGTVLRGQDHRLQNRVLLKNIKRSQPSMKR